MLRTLALPPVCTRGYTWKTRDAGYRRFGIAPSLSTRSEFLEKRGVVVHPPVQLVLCNGIFEQYATRQQTLFLGLTVQYRLFWALFFDLLEAFLGSFLPNPAK